MLQPLRGERQGSKHYLWGERMLYRSTSQSLAARSAVSFKIWALALTLVSAAFWAVPVDQAFAASKYKVTDFARLPAISSPKISPNGEYLAMAQPFQGRRAVFIYHLDTREQPAVIPAGDEGDVRIGGFEWVNSERLIITVVYPFVYSPQQFYGYKGLKLKTTASRTIAVNRDGSQIRVLFKDQQGKVGRSGGGQTGIIDMLGDDPEHILIVADVNRNGHVTVNKVNTFTGKSHPIASGNDNTQYFQTDWDGNIKLRFDYDYTRDINKIFVKNKEGIEWSLLSEAKQLSQGEISPIAFSIENPDHLYIQTRAESGREAIYLLDITTGEYVEKIFEHDKVDVRGMSFFHDTHEPRAVRYTDGVGKVHYLSERARKEAELFDRAIPGTTKWAYSYSEDSKRQIIVSMGPSEVPTYYLLDFAKRSVSELGRTYPTLDNADMAEVRPYSFKARDGVEIPTVLTLPKGATGRLPTVIMPHGGPRSQSRPGFDFMAQLFASRGYAVVEPNYRGSIGYGHDFETAGYHEWGLKMQDDVTDATKKVIADGIADPSRICIVGWSYGAYAAMMGVVKEPSLYKCGAAINGVYDLVEVMNRYPSIFQWYHNYWGKLIGNRNGGDLGYMMRSSPALRASEIKVPVFLAAGEVDRTVLPNQTRIMEKALKKAGKQAEVYYYPHGDHSMQYEPELQDMFIKLDAFLAKNLKD